MAPQTAEPAVDSSNDELFQRAVAHVKGSSSNTTTSNNDKLKFYALYKQATDGNCTTPEPSRFNMVAHAKWTSWMSYQGLSRDGAMAQYIKTLQSVDPSFTVSKPAAVAVVETPSLKNEKSLSKEPARGMSSTRLSIIVCACVLLCGIVSFHLTVFSKQALLCIALIGAGLLGIFGSIAMYLDEHGLISYFSPRMQMILLEKSTLEVITEGVLVKAIREYLQELSPIVFARTHDERMEALRNMKSETRKSLTVVGAVNSLPGWLQRLVLSRRQYDQMKANPRYSPATAIPIIRAGEGETTADLDSQRELTRQLIRNLMRNKQFGLVIGMVDPKACKAVAIGLFMFMFIQIRGSEQSRKVAATVLRVLGIVGSGTGAVMCVGLAFAHRLAKRELALDNQKLLQN